MISVIVPVYNVENYLAECVESVLRQTYRDFELILVDDGSTDSSGEMCDGFAAADPRVRVIHDLQGGLVMPATSGSTLRVASIFPLSIRTTCYTRASWKSCIRIFPGS